jgi:hypothetical protein
MTWKPKSARFKRVQTLQATIECAVNARVAFDASRGVTTSRRTRQRVATFCACRRCRPPAADECPFVAVPSDEEAIQASLRRIRARPAECFYCGSDISEPKRRYNDFMTPAKLGGANDPRNRVAACQRCMSSKRTKTSEEYRTALEKLRGTAVIFYGERSGIVRCPRYPHDGDFAFLTASRKGTHARFPCERAPGLITIPGWTDATHDARGSRIETPFDPLFLAGKTVEHGEISRDGCDLTVAEPVPVVRATLPATARRRKQRILATLRARRSQVVKTAS